MAGKRVCVGLPVYNGERYLREAVDSILAQDYDNFELILSDNASTDSTAEICAEYARRDRRVRYERNETNIGAMANFQRVFDLSTGDYFMWGAYDDQWEPNYISTLSKALDEDTQAILASGWTLYVDVDNMPYTKRAPDPPPPMPYHSGVEVAQLFLRTEICSWLYGIWNRELAVPALRHFWSQPAWGGDGVLLMYLFLNHRVIGSRQTRMYKRMGSGTTARLSKKERVKWQVWYTRAICEQIRRSPVSSQEKLQVSLTTLLYLKRIFWAGGFLNWLVLLVRAAIETLASACHRGQPGHA